jgi:hypothetical protein
MEQRRLRLGDILDDYCPRERRVTNHAIVAMIEEEIKQTRCITCDAEHVYKGARVPRRRKGAVAAAPPALASVPGQTAVPPSIEELNDMSEEDLVPVETNESETDTAAVAASGADDSEAPVDATPTPDVEDGPVHRPLIRATLPRPEGFPKEERRMPEFTVRQPGTRGGNGHGQFRAGKMRAPGNGNRPHGRFSRGPGGGRGGAVPGFRSGPPRHGGKKRSR